MVPAVRPNGAVARIPVSLRTVKEAALRPLNCTWVAPTKCEPVRVTLIPDERVVGVKDARVGTWAASTVKEGEVAVPLAVVIRMVPVVAVAGTTASISEALTTEYEKAGCPLNETAEAP